MLRWFSSFLHCTLPTDILLINFNHLASVKSLCPISIGWPPISRFLSCHPSEFQGSSVSSLSFLMAFVTLLGISILNSIDLYLYCCHPLDISKLVSVFSPTFHILCPPPSCLHIFISPLKGGFYPCCDLQPLHALLFSPSPSVFLTLLPLSRLLPLSPQMFSFTYPLTPASLPFQTSWKSRQKGIQISAHEIPSLKFFNSIFALLTSP